MNFWSFLTACFILLTISGIYSDSTYQGCTRTGFDAQDNPIYSCPTKNGAELQIVIDGKIVKLKNGS